MKTNDEEQGKNILGEWVTFRPEIKVLDCTIRDGGLMNSHQFDDRLVRAIYEADAEAGIDYLEVGYKSSRRIFSPSQFGCWKYCIEDDLRRVIEKREGRLKIAVMADAERTDYHQDILPASKSIIDLVRVATYIHQIPTAIDMLKDAADKGYETTVNIMAISVVKEAELDAALEALTQTEAAAIYLVDSFGALYGEQIQYLTKKYLKYAKAAGKEVGIHTHNNQQLAYANTIEALILGATRLDASLAGLGRGAGNCPLELLLGFLHNPKFHLRPILKCNQDYIEPLRENLRWGFDIPYMISGQLNQHPREAMKFMASDRRKNIVEFYDASIEEE